MRRFASPFRFVVLFLLSVVSVSSHLETAHKPVTSRYTYNDDIFVILRNNCGRCHVEGGPTPMGLMRWNDGPNSATPWAESIRQSIVGERMPPWYVDPQGPAVKQGFVLSAAESDKLLTWATGGTPEGNAANKPATVVYQPRWSGGPPDLKLQMEQEYVMAAGEKEVTRDFIIPTGMSQQRWLKAIDLLPGSAEIVRNASIALENGTVLAVWAPGDNLVQAPAGTAFRLPAGAKLQLQIHYKKQWQNEGKTITDRSTVGLYFTAAPRSGREIQSFTIAPSPGAENTSMFARVLPMKARVVALRPSLDRVYGAFTIQAIVPGGAKIALLKLRAPRPEWRRRYWLAQPVELPAGSRIEVTTTPSAAYIDLTDARFVKGYALEASLDFVATGP